MDDEAKEIMMHVRIKINSLFIG
jgi:hypothetical protein